MKPNLTTIILLAGVRWVRAKWQAWHTLTGTERLRITGRMTLQELMEDERRARGLELAAASPLLALAADTPAAWAHEALGAALELFNKVWPVLGLIVCTALLLLVVLTFISLVDACRRGPGSGWGQAYKGEGEADE